MLRSEVVAGLQALRFELERYPQDESLETKFEYYDKVLAEARLAVLLNEQNDPHAKL